MFPEKEEKLIDKKFSCNVCDETFSQKSNLQEHITKVHFPPNRVPLKCDYCSYETMYKSRIKKHLQSKHESDKEERLSECSSSSANVLTVVLDSDIQQHHMQDPPQTPTTSNENQLICHVCGKLFSAIGNRNKHLKNIHKIFPKEKEKLIDKEFSCNVCDKTFSQKSNLKKHITTVHFPPNEALKCDYCSYETMLKSNLKRHFQRKHESSKEERLSECSLYSENLLTVVLDSDIQQHHMQDPPQTPTSSNENQLICHVCGKLFNKSGNYNKHLKTIHKIFPEEKEKLIDKQFSCNVCDKTFRYKSNLQQHINIVHFPDNKASFKCDYCSYETMRKSDLKRHLQSKHESGKEERLSECSSSSANVLIVVVDSDIQQNHMQDPPQTPTTSNENQSLCHVCGKSFKSSDSRNKHLKNIHKIYPEEKEKLIDKKFSCNVCDKTFTKKFNLKKHIDLLHFPDNKASFKCDHCSYETIYKTSFDRHVQRYHGSNNDEQLLKCSLCKSSFIHLHHLKYHERKFHSSGSIKSKSTVKGRTVKRQCPKCSFLSTKPRRYEILAHFEKVHNIAMKCETYTFDDLESFHEWKKDLEKSTNTYYLMKGATTTSKQKSKSIIYNCHRNGNFKSKGKNIRRMRILGTNKIDAYCPSTIHVKISQTGFVRAKYWSAHVGHKNEIKYIRPRLTRLTCEERKKIASKLSNEVPRQSILNDIGESFVDCKLKKIHLVTKKDIHNIVNLFNEDSNIENHPIDQISVEVLIKELEEDKRTSLLLFKPQGICSDHFPNLKEEDFMFIYMTKAQKAMIEAHGNDIVCVDGTDGLNPYNFQLFVVQLIDDSREGFPVAFMLTNRGDKDVIEFFFQKMKDECGLLTPSIFMSDTEETFYNAWSRIMAASSRLFCTWHVLKDWNRNLNKIITIELRHDVYSALKSLLYDLNKENFHKKLDAIKAELEQMEETRKYYEYFENHFIENERYKCWAYSYRFHAGINTNISLENFDELLKYFYLEGKTVQRQDLALGAILRLLKDKMLGWFFNLKKGKIGGKLAAIRDRHKKSIQISDRGILELNESTWQVSSSSEQHSYIIEKINKCLKCQLRCIHCQSCVHEFTCSCADCAIHSNMCKHIHLVARSILDHGASITAVDTDSVSGDNCETIFVPLVDEVSADETVKKENLYGELEEIIAFCDSERSEEEMDRIRAIIRSTKSALEAIHSTSQLAKTNQ